MNKKQECEMVGTWGTRGGGGEMHTSVLWVNLKKRDYLEKTGLRLEDNINMNIKDMR
jgi:hypothetical protein